MKSIKEQVIEVYDKHYVSSCGEVVDLTLEKVEKLIDDKKKFYANSIDATTFNVLEELKLSLKGDKK